MMGLVTLTALRSRHGREGRERSVVETCSKYCLPGGGVVGTSVMVELDDERDIDGASEGSMCTAAMVEMSKGG